MDRTIAGWTTVALLLLAQADVASAHVSAEHLGGGLAAGFVHPLTGLDHLAAALMTGWIAIRHGQAALVFLAMLGIGMAAGALLGIASLAETVILLSLPMLATILLLGRRLRPAQIVPMLALFAFAHGYAHGSEIDPGMTGVRFAAGAMAANILLVFSARSIGRLVAFYRPRAVAAR